MRRRVLITGALGYLGGRIGQVLSETGRFDLLLGTRRDMARIPFPVSNARLIAIDLASPESIIAACKGSEAVVHLAAMNEIDSARDPDGALLVNGIASMRLFELAAAVGVKRVVYFSTAHVYGAPLQGHITESTLPRPLHPYAISHRVAEDCLLAANDQKKLEGVVVRLSNGFGAPAYPGVNRWTLVANDLCRQAVTSRRLVLKSSGVQKRDFVPLADVARATLHLLEIASDDLADGLFNLGGENSLSIAELANLIAARCRAVLGFTPPIERPAPLSGEVINDLHYDSAKLRRTGFVLTGRLEDEIDATLRVCNDAFLAV